MTHDALAFVLLGLTFGALLLGYPVAFTLIGTSLGFALVTGAVGAFDTTLLLALPSRIWSTLTNELLLAIPLFVLMGTVLDRSGIAAELLERMGNALRRVSGGLGLSLCLVGALLAASTGIVGATVVAMGLISLPVLLARGYPASFASGLICATGSLGQIIPPSIVLILLADQLSAVYGEAQRSVGNWAASPVSVGDLFAGALIPGAVLAGAYAMYVWLTCRARGIDLCLPDSAKPDTRGTFLALVAPLFLLVAVLGSILSGIATPTEAAAIGMISAILLAAVKCAPKAGMPVWFGIAALVLALVVDRYDGPALFVWCGAGICAAASAYSLFRVIRSGILQPALTQALRMSAMVYGILVGATCFALVFRGLGGDDTVNALLTNLPGGTSGALIFVMLVIFVLGFFLDVIEIITLAVPILSLTLLQEIDPLWFGILVALNLQTSYLTPPFGFALFYFRGVAPDSIKTTDIYRGVVPFILIQLAVLGLVVLWPQLVTALPDFFEARRWQ